jgi:hypothetical protein
VVYASHIYPAHAEAAWGYYFGLIAESYPMLITEWGFVEENPSAEQPYLNDSAAGYGQFLMSYLSERKIGWVACWYDDRAESPMFQSESKDFTGYGEFVMDRLGQRPGSSKSIERKVYNEQS